MRLTLRVLSALLRYPEEPLRRAIPELPAALVAEGALDAAQRAALDPLFTRLTRADLLDSQEAYVSLFDRGRALSLHLFEHVHGESRDRGQAMVDLRERYVAQDLEIVANELPDYLPLFLEYLSVLPPAQARAELAETGVILSALAGRLEERASDYAAPLRALAELAGAGDEAFAVLPADDPDDLAALDAAWAEEQVRFDAPQPAGAGECPQAAAIVARMRDAEPARSPVHG